MLSAPPPSAHLPASSPSPGEPGVARAAVIIVAGGSGTRLGGELNKVYRPVAGMAAISWSVQAALACPQVGPIVIVARADEQELAAQSIQRDLGPVPLTVVPGGATRHQSEVAGLAAIRPAVTSGQVEVIAVHDAARPLASSALFAELIELAHLHGGAIPVLPTAGLLPWNTQTWGTGNPAGLVAVQTPQVFQASALLAAYALAGDDGWEGTDTASTMERYAQVPVVALPGPADNLKITYPPDLETAQRRLSQRSLPPTAHRQASQ